MSRLEHVVRVGVAMKGAGSTPTSEFLLGDLTEDARGLILEQLVQEGSRELCGRLYERCLVLFGSGNCGAGHPIWRQACERFGLRRMVEADWRATFQRLCRELQILRTTRTRKPVTRRKKRLDVFFLFVHGRVKEVDIEEEWLCLRQVEKLGLSVLLEAFIGLGAGDIQDRTGISQENLELAFNSGDVNAVKAVLGTGVNAGVHELFVGLYEISVKDRNLAYDSTYLAWMRLLLKAGVRTDARSMLETPLLKATVRTSLGIGPVVMRLLLEYGADPNDGGELETPLIALLKGAQWFVGDYVAEAEFVERLTLLLDANADPTLRDANGWSAITVAQDWWLKAVPQRPFWEACIVALKHAPSTRIQR